MKRFFTTLFATLVLSVLFFLLSSSSVLAGQLNPGCDLEVRAYGVDTISDHFLVDTLYQTMITKGVKWWKYDVRPGGGIGGFVQGGENTSTLFLQHLPACFNNGSFEINPGCDPEVGLSGMDIINHQSFVGSNQVLLTKGKKWWVYDAYVYEWEGAFIDGGEKITGLFTGTLPNCKDDGSFEINPGCDSDVNSSGFDIITHKNLVGDNQVLLTRGTKWWIYDASVYDWTGSFIDGGEDLASFIKDKAYSNGNYTPDCFNNGSFELNPGCDSDVQYSGLDAISDHFLVDPLYQVILTKGKKWWIYDTRIAGGSGGYVDGGGDIGSLFMTYLPSCNVSVCFADEDCGIDGYIGNYFCDNDDVRRNYVYYNCTNPGTTNSSCTDTVVSALIDDCEANEYCVAGNSTCQTGQAPTTTTQPSSPGPGGEPPMLVEDEIENKIEDIYQRKEQEQATEEISNLLEDIDFLKLNITDPEHLNKIEELERKLLEINREVELFENQIKERGIVYQAKWFFGLAAKTEKGDADFFEGKSQELIIVADTLKSLAYEIEDENTVDIIIEDVAELRVQSNKLSRKATKKLKNRWGIFSWIKSFFDWILSLFRK